jgi:hypothetical protein
MQGTHHRFVLVRDSERELRLLRMQIPGSNLPISQSRGNRIPSENHKNSMGQEEIGNGNSIFRLKELTA